jgi:hypothetical protein
MTRALPLMLMLVVGTALTAQDHNDHDHGHDHGHKVRFRLLDLSLNIMTAAGTSTATDHQLRRLQLGDHDPRRRGFTLQQAEFAFAGALEPYFAGEAYLVAHERGIELEEAFLRSLSIPYFELKAGYFFTEFGNFNRLHPHHWRWADQPVVNGRILGPEGMRGVGARVAFEPRWTMFSRLMFAVQNADNESMVSFLGEGHDHGGHDDDHDETIGGWPLKERTVSNLGDLLYSIRYEGGANLGPLHLSLGLSGAFGPNATGPTGKTWLAGADMKLGWRKGDWFAGVEGEFIYRYFQANRAEFEEEGEIEILQPTVLGDWGTWVELYAGYDQWRFGVRLEHASGFRSGEEIRREDPRRDDRYRISPLVGWQPVEMIKVTVQYNFDYAQHRDDRTAHTVWVGLRVLFGVHKHLH